MATPPYTPLDPNAPNGATQSPAVYAASDLANVKALRDAVVSGHVPGYAYSQSGGSNAAPTYRIWIADPLRFRMWAVTYDGAITYLPLTIKWQWSNDAGATWADMDATATTLTWDTVTNVKLLTVSRDAGAWCIALNGLIAALYAGNSMAAHAALAGTAVHGLGTMATQNANAVAIAGGNIAGTIANSQVNASALNGATRLYPAIPPALVTGVNWDWAATPTHCRCAPGIVIPAIVNIKEGEVKRLYVYGGIVTFGAGGAAIFFGDGFAWGGFGNVLSLVAVELGAVVISNMTFG